MKLKYLLFLILTFLIINNVHALDIQSNHAIMYNLDEDKVLYEKNSEDKVQIASLTKIMTAIVTLDEVKDLNKQVTLKSNDFKNIISQNLVTAGFLQGQTITYKDLLYGLLLPSGAEAAKALANNVAGTEENFVKLMNDKAKELNLNNTHFQNPIGLDDENNYSTAKDVATMFKYALKNQTFKEIITTSLYTSSDKKVTMKSTVKNNKITGNYLLGGKTGTTTGAGLCLASIAKDDKTTLMLITLNAPYDKKGKHNIEDAKTIYENYIDNYNNQTILNKKDVVLTLKTKYAKKDKIDFYSDKNITKYLPNNTTNKDLKYEYKGIKEITPKMNKGKRLGTLKIYYKDELLNSQDIILKEKQQFDIIKFIKLNKEIFIAITLIIFLIILTFIIIKKKLKKKS